MPRDFFELAARNARKEFGMNRFALNEPDPDPYGVNPNHEDDERRQRDWLEMVEWLRQGRTSVSLRHVADLLDDRRDPYYGTVQPLLDAYAEAYGWPMLIRAIAQAMAENQQHQRELMDRR